MDNVQRKLTKNFVKWRADKKKNETKRETLENNIQEYMQKTFQIKTESLSILDILDTMIAPNPDASVAANGVRGNIFACKGTCQKRFSGIRPLRGGVPPFSAKEKILLFFTVIFR